MSFLKISASLFNSSKPLDTDGGVSSEPQTSEADYELSVEVQEGSTQPDQLVPGDFTFESLNFETTCQAAIRMVKIITGLHPLLAPLGLAFETALQFELARKRANKHVRALHVVMIDMMNTIKGLDQYPTTDPKQNPDHALPDSLKIRAENLEKLMKAFTTETHSYMQLKAPVQWLSSPSWLQKLREYAKLFDEQRRAFQQAIMVVISNQASQILDQVQSNERKLDAIMKYLEISNPSPLQQFVGKHDGESILQDSKLFAEGYGYYLQEKTQSGARPRGADLEEEFKDMLRHSSKTYWLRIIESSTRTFEATLKTLETQSKQQSDRIIREIRRGIYQEIGDPFLSKLWSDMKWNRCVETRYFVAALREFCAEIQATIGQPTDSRSAIINSQTPTLAPVPLVTSTSPSPTETISVSAEFHTTQAPGPQIFPDSTTATILLGAPVSAQPPVISKEDEWTLKYISPLHIQPLLEAIDSDGSSFISVTEVNAFMASKPEGWTLLRWMAYWTVGFSLSVEKYRNKISGVFDYVRALADKVALCNKRGVEDTLGHLLWVERTIAGLSTVGDNIQPLDKDILLDMFDSYLTEQESKIDEILTNFQYSVDSLDFLMQVFRPHRLEEYLLPLLFLMLNNLAESFRRASSQKLETAEFEDLKLSFASIKEATDRRVKVIHLMCKMMNRSTDDTFTNYALGMYRYHSDRASSWTQSSYYRDKYVENVGSRRYRRHILSLDSDSDTDSEPENIDGAKNSQGSDDIQREVEDLFESAADHSCVSCDGCDRMIYVTRLVCIDCTTEILETEVNSMDICAQCRSDTCVQFGDDEPRVHSPSHSLLQLRRDSSFLFEYDLPHANKVVEHWRNMAIKKRMRSDARTKCHHCRQPVNDSAFWKCVECEVEIVICDACNTMENNSPEKFLKRQDRFVELTAFQEFYLLQTKHHWNHTLVYDKFAPQRDKPAGEHVPAKIPKSAEARTPVAVEEYLVSQEQMKTQIALQTEQIRELMAAVSLLKGSTAIPGGADNLQEQPNGEE